MRAKLTLCLGLVLAFAFSAGYAQEQTSGTLEGTVVQKDAGTPIADALVTAAGPQGIRTTTTNGQGRYVLRGLTGGTYSVTAEAPGFNKVSQSDVRVSSNSRVQLMFELAKGVTETVEVTSTAPLVDLRSTSTGANVTIDEFAPYVPLGRNLVSVFSIAPGVSDGGQLGQTNSSISGSSGLENTYFVDGVNITNSGYGALGAYSIVYGSLGTGVTYDFLEEVQVKTGGFEPEFGQAGGGVVNSVVRSGSNEFALDFSWYEEPGSLEGSRNDRVDSPNIANVVDTERRDIALSVGGPILEDKLFYFAAYNPIEVEDTYKLTSGSSTNAYDLDGDGTADDFFGVGQTVQGGRTPGEVVRKRSNDNYAAKVSWYMTPNHKIDVTAFGDPSDGDVGPQNPTAFLRVLADPLTNPDPSTSATGLDYGGDQYSAKYSGVWTPNFFSTVQFSHKENTFTESGPGTNFRSVFDPVANNTSGGAGFYEDLADQVDQINLKNTHIFGPVEVSYGYQSEDIDWAQPRAYSGPAYTDYFPNLVEDTTGAVGFANCPDATVFTDPNCYTALTSSTGASITGTTTFNVDRTEFAPIGETTNATEDNYFVQATWEATPTLTIKAGARYTEQELTGSGSFSLPIGVLPSGAVAGGVTTSLSAQSYKFDGELAPRVGFTWDVLNNGEHKVYGNYAEYYQRVPSDLAVRAFSNEVGVTSSGFGDEALLMPLLDGTCSVDTDNNGLFDDGTTVPCHRPATITGLAGGGSIILDGTQLQAGSSVNSFLGSNAQLVSGGATKLPFTEEFLAGYAWQVNDKSNIEVRLIHREIGRALEDIQFTSNEQTQNGFIGTAGNASRQFSCVDGGGNPLPGCDLDPGTDDDGDGIADNDPRTLVPGVYNGDGTINPAGGDPFGPIGAGEFGAYVFANVGDNVNTQLFPVPVRDYDALEFIYNLRFSNGWMAYVNYRWAELQGNYEGSFRNDNGQSDPFLTSLFDFPAASAVDTNNDGTFDSFVPSQTLAGQFRDGPLNTDRTHVLNAFLSRRFDFGLNLGGRMTVRSGQPQGPLFAHPAYQNSGEIPGFNAQYFSTVVLDEDGDSYGDSLAYVIFDGSSNLVGTMQDLDDDGTNDGTVLSVARSPRLFSYDVVERDFFGRTSTLITFDMSASYDIQLRNNQSKLTLHLDVFNLFDDNGSISFDNAIETRPGVANIDFLKANAYQPPRNVRLGVKFSW